MSTFNFNATVLTMLLAFLLPFRAEATTSCNSEDVARGVVYVHYDDALGPDGQRDDAPSIRHAINTAILCGIPVVQLGNSETYYINTAPTTDRPVNSIGIWYSGITLDGNGSTFIDKRQADGNWGETLAVRGLIPVKAYPVEPNMAANINGTEVAFSARQRFTGTTAIKTSHVVVKNLTITHVTVPTPYLNTIGIYFADDVTLENVTSNNAPQTAFAIVADNAAFPASNINLVGTTANNSGRNAYRISLQGTADTLGVRLFKCAVNGVRNPEENEKSDSAINGHRVAVWYRASTDSDSVRLAIDRCTFDASGEIFATMGAKNLSITNSTIKGGITVAAANTRATANLRIENNTIDCTDAKKYSDSRPPAVVLAGFSRGVMSGNKIVGNRGPWLHVDKNVIGFSERAGDQ